MQMVIKVGTQSILSPDGVPFMELIDSLLEQIALIKKAGHEVVLVSSGAVSSGRKLLKSLTSKSYGKSVGERQVLAALGQPELMQTFQKALIPLNILPTQILLTKQDFQTRKHYLNISSLFTALLKQPSLLPVINENDSVSINELMFTDNDELAGLLAALIGAEKLIILSNVDGVYTGHPDNPQSKLISAINPDESWPEVSLSKSMHGKGGMHSKLKTAKLAASLGITTHIASANTPNVVQKLIDQQQIGTVIHPKSKKSNIKRWIAYYKDKQNGIIYINDELNALLRKRHDAMSILPVGLVKYEGHFKKGDTVEIKNLQNETVGVGLCRYDNLRLSEYIGKKNQPIFIHYDHLHIY